MHVELEAVHIIPASDINFIKCEEVQEGNQYLPVTKMLLRGMGHR